MSQTMFLQFFEAKLDQQPHKCYINFMMTINVKKKKPTTFVIEGTIHFD